MSDFDAQVKAMAEAPMDALTKRYREIREKKGELTHELNKQIEPLDQALDALARAMLAKLNKEKSTSQKTLHGTVYIYPHTTGTIVDFDALWEFIRDEDKPELLQRRLTLSEVTANNEANPDAPVPGVQLETIQTVRVKAK